MDLGLDVEWDEEVKEVLWASRRGSTRRATCNTSQSRQLSMEATPVPRPPALLLPPADLEWGS